MKLLRVGPKGLEKPALLLPQGGLKDLSSVVDDIDGAAVSPEGLKKISSVDSSMLPDLDAGLRIGAPVARPHKYLAIGINYADHAKEFGAAVPDEPLLFTKATSCIGGPYDVVSLPDHATKADYEAELTIVIGTRACCVSADHAMDYVAGYMLANDISERGWQKETSGQWIKGKSFDGFGPLGPWFVTKDEIADPHALDIFLRVNGEERQVGNTKDMIFQIPEIIATVSRYLTLEPGDFIATGTPPGVGGGMSPPQYLKPGDEIVLGVEGLGEQRFMIDRLAES